LGFLKSAQITELVICGMMTHICIDTKVRAAYDHGFKTIVIGDAHAKNDLKLNGIINPKEVQITYLASLKGTFAEVTKTNDFIQD
jgi:isochorismate hydrolase